jgi:TPP-dependent 2-oxoacid decarboxylase
MEIQDAEQNPVIQIMYEHFSGQYKGDEEKIAAAINYVADLVQQEGCKLVHYGDVVFMVSVAAEKMVEFHAMIGGKKSDSEKLAVLNKELDKLLKYLKGVGVALAFTHMPTDKVKVFSKVLEEYKFTRKEVASPDGKKVVAFYIGLEG